MQSEDFQEEMRRLFAEVSGNVTFAGRYMPEELPGLMADVDYVVLPSIWWENAPRVIQEAFAYGRPVICSGIGGMAEKVTDGVNGFHFRVGDHMSLADVIRRAVEPGVWDRLRQNLPPLHAMDVHARNLSRYYTDMIERRAVLASTQKELIGEPVA
jgi:glycosyltransferase involved in cell wall biosynthesis